MLWGDSKYVYIPSTLLIQFPLVHDLSDFELVKPFLVECDHRLAYMPGCTLRIGVTNKR